MSVSNDNCNLEVSTQTSSPARPSYNIIYLISVLVIYRNDTSFTLLITSYI